VHCHTADATKPREIAQHTGKDCTNVLDELYDIPQICQALKISPRTCRSLIRSGALPTIRVGRMHRISKAALDAWVNSGGTKDRYEGLHVAQTATQ
jgi:excisionase family DNA binding protein